MPISLITGAIGGFAGAFNKDRYKTEYHYGTQELKKQNKELKELMQRAKDMPVQEQAKTILPVQTQPNETKNSMKKYLIIGGVAVLGLVAWLFMRKPKNKQLK